MIIVVPAATPVTKPEQLTVATVLVPDTQGLDEAAVPEPVSLVVDPTQTASVPVMVGEAFTVTEEVVLLHPVVVDVNVNVALPADTPVTTPASVTCATAVLLLVQVPPVIGDSAIVLPTHTEDPALTTGNTLTVNENSAVLVLVPLSIE